MKDYKGGKKQNFDKFIGKVVQLKTPNNNKSRYFWIVEKNSNGRYIIRSPKIGILIKDLDKLKDKDYGPKKIMPLGTKII